MNVLLLLVSAVLIVVSVIIFRLLALSSRQSESIPGKSVILDENALAERLEKAVKFQTVSYEDKTQFNQDEFIGFQIFLELSFPKVHAAIKKEIVSDYSILYTWEGQDDKELPILLAAHMDVVPAESNLAAIGHILLLRAALPTDLSGEEVHWMTKQACSAFLKRWKNF